MASELIAGLGLFKTMMDIAKGLKDTNDAAIRNAAVIELQEKIFSAQTAQATLIERVRELEEEVASFEAWDTEKQRYKLTKCGYGAVAYVLKKAEEQGEPGHALCTSCYQRRIKSILQSNGEPQTMKHAFVCPVCKAAVKASTREMPEFAV